jgi:hypothetical protein
MTTRNFSPSQHTSKTHNARLKVPHQELGGDQEATTNSDQLLSNLLQIMDEPTKGKITGGGGKTTLPASFSKKELS